MTIPGDVVRGSMRANSTPWKKMSSSKIPSAVKMLDYFESFTLQKNTFFGMEVKFGGSHEGGEYCLSTDKMYWFRSPMNDVCSEYLFNSLSLET